MNGLAHYDRDRMQAEATTPARQRFVSSENPHRDDWRSSLRDDEPDPGEAGLKFSIESTLVTVNLPVGASITAAQVVTAITAAIPGQAPAKGR